MSSHSSGRAHLNQVLHLCISWALPKKTHFSLGLSRLWRCHWMERQFPSSPYVLSQTPTTFHMTHEVIMENNNSSYWVIANIYSVRMCQALTIPIVLHAFIRVNLSAILWARCCYYLCFLRHTVSKLPKASQLVLVRGEVSIQAVCLGTPCSSQLHRYLIWSSCWPYELAFPLILLYKKKIQYMKSQINN